MRPGQLERRCHWLSKNKTERRPEAILFLDTEARIDARQERIQEHSFRLGVGCFCTYSQESGLEEQEWRDLHRLKDLWRWVLSLSDEHDKLIIIAHNMDYDSRLCRAFFYLPRMGWEPTYAIMARTCSMFVWKLADREIMLLDNMNWWPTSLKQLGDSVGLPKMQIDFETATDDELFPYCRRDVEILVKLWKEWFAFLDEHHLGSFGITVAKQAFNAYRHKFMPCHIGIHNRKDAVELARRAYKGGRSECFFVGKPPAGTYYKVDVNSLYATMMKWYPMPCKLYKVIQNVTPKYLDYLLNHWLCIADVILDAKTPAYVKRISGRSCYPAGTFLTSLCTPELELARINDEIVGVGQVALYESADLFTDYVDFFTPLRAQYQEKGDTARANMCKLLRNALQGKFGQRGYKQEVIGDAPIDLVHKKTWLNSETGENCVDYTFGGKVIRQYQGGEPWDSLPAIPTHISAYGRMYMWSLMQQARVEHVFYTDTDSMIVDQEGFDNLAGVIDPGRMGYLKVEGVTDDLEINARKDYRFGDLRTLKGIKDSAVELSPGLYSQWHFTTMRGAFHSQDLDGIVVYEVEKQIRYGAVAGTVGPDGWVRPPHLTLSPDTLLTYLADYERDRLWVWEFEPRWLSRTLREAFQPEAVESRERIQAEKQTRPHSL
ncbi:unnamed protein product [marine sediment metagenome]|uniref:DNA-directed DNA polymerase n=1 Tax=marine sediment metagenome TaxID=412755 RepID=X1G3D0_9ZZZZ